MFIANTEVGATAGQLPSAGAQPTTFNPGYPTTGLVPPMPNPTDTATLPIFSGTAGYSDTGVGHSGDLGGAGAR